MAHRPVTVLLTGGSGRLGSAIKDSPLMGDINLHAPTREDLDITIAGNVASVVEIVQPDIIIHAAAFVNGMAAELTHKTHTWDTNVQGTWNVCEAAKACYGSAVLIHGSKRLKRLPTRVVFISTEYVFDGDHAPYHEYDRPSPITHYGITKVIGEQYVLHASPNNLVIRAPFRPLDERGNWPYRLAFTDMHSTARFLPEVVPDIIRAALSNLDGMLHIGGPCRSIYELAAIATWNVGQCSRRTIPMRLPADTSLVSTRWEQWKTEQESAGEDGNAARI